MSDIDYKLKVMQAYKDGKKIQGRLKYAGHPWSDDDTPSWDWAFRQYRIKPEPRVFYINRYPSSIYRIHKTLELADKRAGTERIECIKVVEVLEDLI